MEQCQLQLNKIGYVRAWFMMINHSFGLANDNLIRCESTDGGSRLLTPANAIPSYTRSILCRARKLCFVVLWHKSVCLKLVSRPRCRTSRKATLTSDTFCASFVSFIRDFTSGTFQSFTPHHHRRILAPTPCPLNLADRFQCRHPLSRSVHSTPCAKQKMTYLGKPVYRWYNMLLKRTWSFSVIHNTPFHDSACSMLLR
jgi:hypothetical protein